MKSQSTKNIVLFLGRITQKHIQGVRDLEKHLKRDFRIALLTTKKETISDTILKDVDIVLRTALQRTDLVEQILLPYKHEIVAILSKYENMMPLYGRLTSLFPYLKNPTPKSLDIATDKFEMRKAFKKYVPKTIPRFIIVDDVKKETLNLVENYIKFPCIIKPASLSQSKLVINCYDREELKKTLETVIKKVKSLYKKGQVEHEPKILVEQLLEGELYSMDVYVNSLGYCYYTPIIEIKTGKDIGHDDFFMYLQMTPATIEPSDIEIARSVVTQGVYALGLRSCTAHAEFYRTKKGFKIVEIAARVGGYRDELLEDAFGIKHQMNDILIRLGKKPQLKQTKKKYTGFLKFWPIQRGILKSIKGFKKNSERDFVMRSSQQKKPGDQVGFSKFGYGFICSFNLIADSRAELLSRVRKIEKSLTFTIKR